MSLINSILGILWTKNYPTVMMKCPTNLVISVASFHTSAFSCKVIPNNLKGRKKSSQDWLTRQLNDPYVKLAHREQYRARSAFKLKEIDDRHGILHHGQVVVECGAAPGAWTQVAIPKINSSHKVVNKPQGMIIGIDLMTIYPLPGAIFLGGKDFTHPDIQEEVVALLKNRKIDVVLSDMAPNASGNKVMDHENIVELAYSALRFAIQHSAVNALFLCKIWEGGRDQELMRDLENFYRSVKIVKPPSSRSNSSEKFLLCRKFKGLKRSCDEDTPEKL